MSSSKRSRRHAKAPDALLKTGDALTEGAMKEIQNKLKNEDETICSPSLSFLNLPAFFDLLQGKLLPMCQGT